MTTGRINQVTVLHARSPRGEPHEAAGTKGSRPVPGQSKSPTDQKSSLLSKGPGAHEALERGLAFRVPSPPISHASEALPRSIGPESTPSVETTDERPHLFVRGLPGRGVSPISWLRNMLAQRQSGPHPSPSPAVAYRGALRG